MFDGQEEFVEVGLSTGERVNIADVALSALKQHDLTVHRDGDDLVLPSGFRFEPRLINLEERDTGSFQSTTIVRFTHPQLFPVPAFEYQHAVGDTLAESLASGFGQWTRMDVATLIDALSEKPRCSTFMDMASSTDNGGEHKRRLVFGPTGHYAVQPDPAARDGNDACEHPFCPCCLTTNSMTAYQDLLQDDKTYGLRLYAARMDGEVSADCRVNGNEFEPGKAALRQYATTWPERGVEFRKQFVVIRSVDVG